MLASRHDPQRRPGGQGVGTPPCSIQCRHELDVHVLVYLATGNAPAELGKAPAIAAQREARVDECVECNAAMLQQDRRHRAHGGGIRCITGRATATAANVSRYRLLIPVAFALPTVS